MVQWLSRLKTIKNIKVSTPEDFDALVSQIELVAQRQPLHYRRRLRQLAWLGYVYIFAVLVLVYGGLLGLFAIAVQVTGYPWISSFTSIFPIVALSLLGLFFVPIKPPKGVRLTRSLHPQFFAVLDELALALKAPKLNRVILTDDLNAAIMQVPRLGFIGWHANYLLVGLPLMQALSPAQCKAVLAHELAHLCGDDGRVAAWIYRVRRTWYELAERFEHNERGGLLFRKFFSWYGPFFRAYSFVHARAQEYEADRRSAELVGAQHEAECSIWLNIHSSLLAQVFWPAFRRRTAQLPEAPGDVVSQQLAALKQPIEPAQAQQWLAEHLLTQTSNAATHPCLAERLAATGYEVPAVLKQSEARAVVWLGAQLAPLTAQLDQLWKRSYDIGWRIDHQRWQHRVAQLARLNGRAANGLTVEEQLQRAIALWELEGEGVETEQVLPWLEALVLAAPNHVAARYWLGALLVRQQTADGVAHLEFAMAQSPALAKKAGRRLYSFFLAQGDLTQAEAIKQRSQQHEKVWRLAVKARQERDDKTQYVAANLPAEERAQLADYFGSFAEVKTVYVARQVMPRFPAHEYFVFAIARRFYRGMAENYKTDAVLRDLLQVTLPFSGDCTLQYMTPERPWQTLRAGEGALLYEYDQP